MSHINLETLVRKQAPDALVLDQADLKVRLSSTWREQPAVLVFLRYFGCPFCQLQVGRLIEDQEKFAEANGKIVLIGHQKEDASKLSRFAPFDYLYDADRSAYKAYGLERGTLMQVTGPRVVAPFIKANMSSATRQRRVGDGDFKQMPGTFVVDTDGIVAMAHRNLHAADNPDNEKILGVLGRLKLRGTLGLDQAAGDAPA